MLIAALPAPDFVVLPELAICSYMASQEMWQYADSCGRDTSAWAMQMAQKYNTCIGVGYLDKEKGEYYNRYLFAGKDKVYGIVTKSEGESAVFKREAFESVINTPFGNIAVAICYDAKRKHFYNNIKDKEISMILFPHGCPADPNKPDEEENTNDFFCESYEKAFGVPVVYVNSTGKLEYMPGKMGELMAKAGFTMNGKTKIYGRNCETIDCDVKEAIGVSVELSPQTRKQDIRFYGKDIIKGNWLFRFFILKKDIKYGLQLYETNR
ncbi:carbon-nitrogen hydrolase family protein [Clostridium sp. BNL1100]|uniref:carbon-nitrogen hydrolase family protein n=1 Tax=Clostridium sp. BNL1100 TaxID=755731 RepID=UPI00024A7893|nr:carbon-nitrogen hydrolase family protein [Clostridium sp. BNL1100]AEY67883.1 putative amidohydrolase [Clostridium sp. BNL1100]